MTKGGAKIYVVQYRMGGRGSKTRRVTIGRHDSPWTAATARREAERLLLQAKTGLDPQAIAVEKRRVEVELAFGAYVERFLAMYGKVEWKPRTFQSAASNLRRWAVGTLGTKSLAAVARRDVTSVLDKIPPGSPALKRSVFAHMRKLFAWAVSRGDIERSPFSGMASPRAVPSRDRVLDSDEMCRVLAGSLNLAHPFGPFVRLLLLTGQRRDEVAGMRWEELSQASGEWRLPAVRTKNSTEHTVPLSSIVASELTDLAGGMWPANGFVLTTTGETAISGFSKMKNRLDQHVDRLKPLRALQPWRLHDLRRSMATGFQRLGIRFEVTEAILNHISGSKSGVAGVYQRHDWSAEKREATHEQRRALNAILGRAGGRRNGSMADLIACRKSSLIFIKLMERHWRTRPKGRRYFWLTFKPEIGNTLERYPMVNAEDDRQR